MDSLLSDTRDVSARDVRLRVVEYGSGPPLLLLHGFLMTHAAWGAVVPALATRFRVVTPDLPGFGDSEKPSPTRFAYGVERFAACIADLIAALSLGRPHVVGHGMGGAIAIALAAAHPEFVDRLVLVDPHVYSIGRRSRAFDMPVLGGFFFKQLYGRALFRAYFRDFILSPGFPLPLEAIDRMYAAFNAPAARESAYATMLATADTRSTEARLYRVRAPSLVIWGRSDRLHPSPLAPRFAREIGAARLEVMEAGHAPHLERPSEFVHRVTSFLTTERG